MTKEEYLNSLSKKFNLSKHILEKYISIVGTSEKDIEDYAMNSTCAVVRKQDDFNVDYTAVMLKKKNQEIAELNKILSGILEDNDEVQFKHCHCGSYVDGLGFQNCIQDCIQCARMYYVLGKRVDD